MQTVNSRLSLSPPTESLGTRLEVMGAQAKGILDFICLITSRNLFTHFHLFDLICLLDIIMMCGGVREKRGEEKRGGREEGE